MRRNAWIAVLMWSGLVVAGIAADLNGRWEGKINMGGDEMVLTFVFKVDGETLTGSVETPMGGMPISGGKITGDQFTFTLDVMGNSIVHNGKITGDEGVIKSEGDMAMEIPIKRVPNP